MVIGVIYYVVKNIFWVESIVYNSNFYVLLKTYLQVDKALFFQDGKLNKWYNTLKLAK